MSRTPRLVLTGMFVALFATAGSSATGNGRTPSTMARIWAINIGSETIEVGVEREQGESIQQEKLTLGPADSLELPRTTGETIRITQQRDLMLVSAGWDLDPATLAIENMPYRVERSVAKARQRDGGAATGGTVPGDGARVENGSVVSSPVLWMGTEQRTLIVGLRGDKSWGEVQIKRPDGAILGYVTLSASRPVKVTIDFGRLLDAKGYWGIVNREIAARSGEVIAFTGRASAAGKESGRLRRVTAAAIHGSGYFNYNINWAHTPALDYTVENGPASTCGELNAQRNGTWEYSPGWLCTDGSGDAYKGPWYWSNQTADETAQAYIRWPNNDTTTTDWHKWDVSSPSISPASYCQGSSPTCWEGFASDPPYGACFSSTWSRVYSIFMHVDYTTGQPLDYWSPSTGTYGNGYTEVNGTMFGLTACSQNCSCGLDWATSFPDSGDHTSGQRYRWLACTTDGGNGSCFQHDFYY